MHQFSCPDKSPERFKNKYIGLICTVCFSKIWHHIHRPKKVGSQNHQCKIWDFLMVLKHDGQRLIQNTKLCYH